MSSPSTDAKKPILVTGAHRSRTTWVGRMLALSPEIGYIHEPFNIASYNRAADFAYWYYYITDENASSFFRGIADAIAFRYDLMDGIKRAQRPRDIVGAFRTYSRFWFHRLRGARPLIKDPIAVFSAEWLASAFDMGVVVMIRHPAAFASSLKRLGWQFDFNDLLQQPLLLREGPSIFLRIGDKRIRSGRSRHYRPGGAALAVDLFSGSQV